MNVCYFLYLLLKKHERVEGVDAPHHGVVVDSILARATMKNPAKSHWKMHFPLYRLYLLTRPYCPMKATTENSDKVAKIRKFPRCNKISINLGEKTESERLDLDIVTRLYHQYTGRVAQEQEFVPVAY